MPDLSTTTISSWTPLRIIWELMTNKVNNGSNLPVFNSKIRSWALVNYPWWLCERFDKDLDFVIFLSSKRFEHCTKNEEILKGKLHFLCSGSRGKRMKEIVSITAELKGVIKVSFRKPFAITANQSFYSGTVSCTLATPIRQTSQQTNTWSRSTIKILGENPKYV